MSIANCYLVLNNKLILTCLTFAFDRNGETCLAQAAEDQRWYRANTQNKVDDNTYNVLYIDYGNMENVTFDRIREMKQEFSFPCITAICFIDGKPNSISRMHSDMQIRFSDLQSFFSFTFTGLCDTVLSPKAVQRLKELIVPYSSMVFDEVQCAGEDTICKSNKIMETLKSEKLI